MNHRTGLVPVRRHTERRCLWILPPLKRRAKYYFRAGSLRLVFPFPPDRGFYQVQRRRSATARKVLSWQMSGGQGCFYYKVKAAIRCARRHRGTPGEGSPRQNSPPDCFVSPPALLWKKNFAPCAERPKTLSLDSAAFEKAGETLNVVGIYFFAICAKSMSGGPGCFYYKVKAAIRCTPARATIFTLEVSFLHNIWYT